MQWLKDDYEKPKQKISWTFIGFLSIPYFIFVGYTYITTYLEEFEFYIFLCSFSFTKTSLSKSLL